MAEIVKEINGHKYKYLRYWDKAEKRIKWKYLGKLEEDKPLSMPKDSKKLLEMALSALYEKCKEKGKYTIEFEPRQLKRLKIHMKEVLEEYG